VRHNRPKAIPKEAVQMMRSWRQSKQVTSQAWGVIKQNTYMLAFPALSAVLAVTVFLVVGGAGVAALGWSNVEEQAANDTFTTASTVTGIVLLVVASYLATLINLIFMGGLVKCADEELQGRDSGFGAGLAAAFSRLPALLGWAAIETIVGWLLRAVQGDGGTDNAIVTILRAILAGLMAMAWTIISFFVLPLIILRGKGPVAAIKESVSLIKRTWGMQVAGGVRIGGIIGLIAVLPAILVTVAGGLIAIAGTPALGVPLAGIGVIVLIVATVLISAMKAIFSVALLHYVEDGSAVGPFDTAELQSAVRARAGRGGV
jgi:hypothetical protein